jgi:hypothetical protein
MVQSGASIYVASLTEMRIQPGPAESGKEMVELGIKIEETLYGQKGELRRRCIFLQPISETARLKFPDRIWGLITPREGLRILLVTHELSEVPADPLYVEELTQQDDPVLKAIRIVLEQERSGEADKERFARYLHYLTDGPTVQKLFGAEALAKYTKLSQTDQEGQVSLAMAVTFASDQDIVVRLNVGTWMWENIYPRTNKPGRVAVINATIKGTEDPSADIRRFSLDHLMMADPADLLDPGINKSPQAAILMEQQLEQETSPDVRARARRVIDVLQS